MKLPLLHKFFKAPSPQVKERQGLASSMKERPSLYNFKLDIHNWQMAIDAAENIERHRYHELQDIYNKAADNIQVSELLNRVILGLQSAEYNFDDKVKGQWWFDKLMKYFIESLFFGYSVIEVSDLDKETGLIGDVTNIDRRHLSPPTKTFFPDLTVDSGVPYDTPSRQKWLFESYSDDKWFKGLMHKMVIYTIYYQYLVAAYSEYTDLYVNPMKVAKTDTSNQSNTEEIKRMMDNLGPSSYAIVDVEEDLTFLTTQNVTGEVFTRFSDMIEANLSKLVLGAVVGEDRKYGSRSKEEIAMNIQDLLMNGYKKQFTSWVNYHVVPKLNEIGYNITEPFSFVQKADSRYILRIVEALKTTSYEIDQDYLQEQLGVELQESKVNETQQERTQDTSTEDGGSTEEGS